MRNPMTRRLQWMLAFVHVKDLDRRRLLPDQACFGVEDRALIDAGQDLEP